MLGEPKKNVELEEAKEEESNEGYSFPKTAFFVIGGIVLSMIVCIIIILLNK